METIETKKVIKLNNKEVQKLNEACSILNGVRSETSVEDDIIVGDKEYRRSILNLVIEVMRNMGETSDIVVVKGE